MKLFVLTLVILAANAGGGPAPAPPTTTTTTTKAPEKGLCKGVSVDKSKCAAHNNDKDACLADMKFVMLEGNKQRCEWLSGDFVDQGCTDKVGASCSLFLKDCPKEGNNVVDNIAAAQWYLDNCMQSCLLCGKTVTFTVGSGCDHCVPPAPTCHFGDYVTHVPGNPACVNNECVFTQQYEACGYKGCGEHGCNGKSKECCKEETVNCLACQNDMTTEEYCKKHGSDSGCKYGRAEASEYLVYPEAEPLSIAVQVLAMVGIFAGIYGTYRVGKSMMA